MRAPSDRPYVGRPAERASNSIALQTVRDTTNPFVVRDIVIVGRALPVLHSRRSASALPAKSKMPAVDSRGFLHNHLRRHLRELITGDIDECPFMLEPRMSATPLRCLHSRNVVPVPQPRILQVVPEKLAHCTACPAGKVAKADGMWMGHLNRSTETRRGRNNVRDERRTIRIRLGTNRHTAYRSRRHPGSRLPIAG